MFDTDIEKTIVITAIALWFAHGWYLNTRLTKVHEKLDQILDKFNGLRNYLYEIDPQFDDERQLLHELDESIEKKTFTLSGMEHMELSKRKEKEGRRTLDSTF